MSFNSIAYSLLPFDEYHKFNYVTEGTYICPTPQNEYDRNEYDQNECDETSENTFSSVSNTGVMKNGALCTEQTFDSAKLKFLYKKDKFLARPDTWSPDKRQCRIVTVQLDNYIALNPMKTALYAMIAITVLLSMRFFSL